MASIVGHPLPAYVMTPLEDDASPNAVFAPGGPPLPVYLNGEGGRYTCGNNNNSADNTSTIACGASPADVGGFPGTPAQWTEVVECVRQQFAPFNLVITDVEPTSGDYVEAVVGGNPWEIGMGSGVGGVSPFICGVIERSIVFTFADLYNEDTSWYAQTICEVTAQEVAHSFGLEHEMNCLDPMTYLDDCGDKSFQDEAAACGEYEPRQCSCGGSTQNSVQMMLEAIGPRADDVAPPTASLISPADGAVLDANGNITVVAEASDDIGAVVTLEWDFAGEAWACPGEDGAWACVKDGSTHTWTINVGEGARTFRVRARDYAGNEVSTEDRAVWLSADGAGPPDDDGPPIVMLASPLQGAVRDSDDTLFIVATAVDDNALAKVELDWPFTDKVFECPSESETVTCTVNGDTYTWALDVGDGDRTFSVRARDLVGNVTSVGPVTITLAADAPAVSDDDHEDDDTIDEAVAVACDSTVQLIADDVDWLALNVPAGMSASVTTSPALPLTAYANVAQPIAQGVGTLDVARAGAVFVEVRPLSAAFGPYALGVVCNEAPVDDDVDGDGEGDVDEPLLDSKGTQQDAPNPSAASCASMNSAWLVALLALLRTRRATERQRCR